MDQQEIEAAFDTVLMEQAAAAAAKDIPPIRPSGYGVTANELAERMQCGVQIARRWLTQNGYTGEQMRSPINNTGKLGVVEVFTKI